MVERLVEFLAWWQRQPGSDPGLTPIDEELP
jgi:hypothetical protein